jgi:hypothetical protein
MKKNKKFGLSAILLLVAVLVGCSNDDDVVKTRAGQSLYVVARQSADAPIQYKAEMPLFSLSNIKSFNTATGEMELENVIIDTHLFYDNGCQYRVYFYDDDDLLFDALAVSFFSSTGYWNQLTFQCDFFGPGDEWDASKSRFYLLYGYPGTIIGDESIQELIQKNAAGMDRFLEILRQAGKIVNAE